MRKIGLFSVLLVLSFMMTIAVTGCSKINEEYEQGSMAAPTKKEVIKMLKRSKRYIYEQHMTRFALQTYEEKVLRK